MNNKVITLVSSAIFLVSVALFVTGIVTDNDQLKVTTAVPTFTSFIFALSGTVRWIKYGPKMKFTNNNQP